MPLHIDIKINDHLLRTIHIGRIYGNTQPDNINTYKVVSGSRPKDFEEWMNGQTFNHRYGDGVEVCVKRALEALIDSGEVEVF